MTDDNFRRELNRVFDDVAGSPSPAMRDRVRDGIAVAPETRGPYWLAGVAAAVIAVLIVGVLVVGGPLRRVPSPAGGGVTQPTPTHSASPVPSPEASPQQLFICEAGDLAAPSGASTPPVAYVSAVRTGAHGSYDRVTIEFSNGVPGDVQISAPGSTTFTASPSGQQLTVKGSHGILVTIHGADLHTAYSGSIDIVTGDATLAEVRRVEDFEGVVQLGLGVNGTGCYRAVWMSNPDRLVIDVQAA